MLQEQEFERVGGEETIKVDVRVLSATNQDLEAEVAAGRFREDLFYRLHVVPVHACRRCASAGRTSRAWSRTSSPSSRPRTNPAVKGLERRRARAPVRLHWPGNVRELENVIEQALVFAEGDGIDVGALPAFVRGGARERARAAAREMSLPEILDDLERQLIQSAYDKSGGVKTETARLLGIKTSALYYKLEKYGIGIDREPRRQGGAAAERAGGAMLDDGPPAAGGGTGRDRAR